MGFIKVFSRLVMSVVLLSIISSLLLWNWLINQDIRIVIRNNPAQQVVIFERWQGTTQVWQSEISQPLVLGDHHLAWEQQPGWLKIPKQASLLVRAHLVSRWWWPPNWSKDVATVAEILPPVAAAHPECSVGVFNATQVAGLAQSLADQLQSQGVRLVRIDSLDATAADSQVILDPQSECSILAKMIAKSLQFELVIQENVEPTYRVAIVVVLNRPVEQFL